MGDGKQGGGRSCNDDNRKDHENCNDDENCRDDENWGNALTELKA